MGQGRISYVFWITRERVVEDHDFSRSEDLDGSGSIFQIIAEDLYARRRSLNLEAARLLWKVEYWEGLCHSMSEGHYFHRVLTHDLHVLF